MAARCECAGGKSFKEEQDEPSDFDAKTIGVRTKAVYDGSLTSLVETDVTNYVMRETGAKHGPSRVLLLIGGSVQTLGELDAFHAAGGFIIVAEDSGGLAGMLGHFMSTRTIPKDSQFAAHERLFVRLIDGGLKGAAKPTRHAERFASGARLAFTSQLKPDNNGIVARTRQLESFAPRQTDQRPRACARSLREHPGGGNVAARPRGGLEREAEHGCCVGQCRATRR
jgi:hypothetical protein